MADASKTNAVKTREERLERRPSLAEPGGAPGGRKGGRLARKVGSRDELKRAFERPASITRVRKRDEQKKP